MYKLEFLEKTKEDIEDIISHIRINNKTAAEKLSNSFSDSIKVILRFPYSNIDYSCDKKHAYKNKYKMCKVKNYVILYTIDEKNKIITIVRVVHQKRNILNIRL